MIDKTTRDSARDKYLANSKEYVEICNLLNEIKSDFVDYLINNSSEEVLDYMKRHPEYIILQKDISLKYQLDYVARGVFQNSSSVSLTIDLGKLNLPTLFPPYFNDYDNEPFYNNHKEFVDKFHEKLGRLNKMAAELNNVLVKLDTVLSEESMNKTSIKKYYPELYNLMYV